MATILSRKKRTSQEKLSEVAYGKYIWIFGSILGYVLWAAFYFLKDFGLSIVVFTIVIRLILFPFTVKQQKSMAGTMRMQRKQKELQEKYANNKVKLQEEMNKLYEKEE